MAVVNFKKKLIKVVCRSKKEFWLMTYFVVYPQALIRELLQKKKDVSVFDVYQKLKPYILRDKKPSLKVSKDL